MSVSAHLQFDALNAALKAAGEETRLRILVLLAEAELTVSDLTQILRQSQPRPAWSSVSGKGPGRFSGWLKLAPPPSSRVN
jgi:DNA-binding transcriptional ArsR family regulator